MISRGKEAAPILEGSPKELFLKDFTMPVPGESTEELIARMDRGKDGISKLEEAVEKEQGN